MAKRVLMNMRLGYIISNAPKPIGGKLVKENNETDKNNKVSKRYK
jgi:hypothetical protein